MSLSITTLNTTDNGSTSRVTINTNFANILASYPTSAILVGTTDTQTLTNKSFSDSTTWIINNADSTKRLNFSIGGTTGITGIFSTIFTTAKTITFPDATDTLVGKATTDVLTNKTFDTAGTGNVFKINGTQITDKTGTGKSVLDTSPTIATPTITKPVMSATNPTAQTYSPAGGATATLDLSLSNQHDITMPAGNITIALSNDTNNQIFIVSITQDGVGSRTVTWFSTIKWAGGSTPTLTTTASKRDTFGFKRTGSATYDGFVIGQNI